MTILVEGPLRDSRNGEKEKALEPPMNTDAHRLKADKAKALLLESFLFFIVQLSVFIGVHRWLKDLCLDLLNFDSSVVNQFGLSFFESSQFSVFSLRSL